MERGELRAPVSGGDLVGWVAGRGSPVLLLHGGPGLSYDYLDSLADEIGDGRAVAAYQQRGLAPSTAGAPFDVPTQVDDVGRVLDALGWDRATVVGHSWGGHLAVHVAAALAGRCSGVLCVDPLGAVGDGGDAEFQAAMLARTPEHVREQARALDERAMRGEGSPDDMVAGLELMWPAYFPDWDSAPPMPPMQGSVEAYAQTWESLKAVQPELEAALGSIAVPMGFVAGAASPIPTTASTDTAERIPGAWVEIVPGAGHFPWLDTPGCVRAALDRLGA